jgi:hypothetical protein
MIKLVDFKSIYIYMYYRDLLKNVFGENIGKNGLI